MEAHFAQFFQGGRPGPPFESETNNESSKGMEDFEEFIVPKCPTNLKIPCSGLFPFPEIKIVGLFYKD